MHCEDYLILIDDLVEGELEARDAEQVNLHLFTCHDCSAYHEMLREEKALYAHVLFDAEPAGDLPQRFLTTLKTNTREEASTAVAATETSPGWFWKLQNFFRFYPSVAFASLLILFIVGFVLLRVVNNQKTDNVAGVNTKTTTEKPSEAKKDKTPDMAVISSEEAKDKYTASAPDKVVDKTAVVKTSTKDKDTNDTNVFTANIRTTVKKPIDSETALLAEERIQTAKLKKLEAETTKQIEKIEILMRSFRNAQALENGDTYDVAYERQQARKLLEKNAQIKQKMGNFGTLYPEDLLSQAEPLLLEIANLGATPSSQKVLEIKERLSSKNIIASLQAY